MIDIFGNIEDEVDRERDKNQDKGYTLVRVNDRKNLIEKENSEEEEVSHESNQVIFRFIETAEWFLFEVLIYQQ